jgi:D-serine dehydratase
MTHLDLHSVLQSTIDPSFKGFPYLHPECALQDLGAQGWNLLRGDLPLPVAILKRSVLQENSRWMRRFAEHFGLQIAPHGKTTMAPQLFEQQLQDGAWGITVANVHQLLQCAQWKIPRVLVANQVIGPCEMQGLFGVLEAYPEMEVFCLVDSQENVEALANQAELGSGRTPGILIEVGVAGKRTGCRTEAEVLDLAESIHQAPRLSLRGVEGYEAVLRGPDAGATIPPFLQKLNRLAEQIAQAGWFAEGPILLSAGGSDYYDLVARHLQAPEGPRECLRIIRSGCYLTHDSDFYRGLFQQILERSPELAQWGPGLQSALQVWGVVQSLPEPGLAFVTLGKRDISYDVRLPVPEQHFSPGRHERPQDLSPEKYTVTNLNDQHAFLKIPPESSWKVGDLVGFGISHPCSTFDRWRLMYLLDDDWNVVEGVRIFMA